MKKCNKKGMTLTEVIIAMCILGVIASMFVTVAVAAKKKNADTAVKMLVLTEEKFLEKTIRHLQHHLSIHLSKRPVYLDRIR